MGSMVVAVLNYLYHPVLSRLMDVAHFGEVQALLSLYLQATAVLGVFGLVALNIFSNQKENSALLETLSTLVMYIMSGIAILFIAFSPYIARALQLENVWTVVAISLAILVATLANQGRFYLQSQHRFNELSISSGIHALGRLVFAALLVLAGWQTFGALMGLLIASFISLYYVFVKTKHAVTLPRFQKIIWSADLSQALRYAVLVFFATGFITLLYTTDVVIVKYLFDPDTAGLYSGTATVARIIIFATGSVAGVLLTYIKINAPKNENKKHLYKALLITSTVGTAGLLVMTVMPHFVIHMLIGSRYQALAPLLPWLALHTLVVSVISVLMYYFLALRSMTLIPVSIAGTASLAMALFLFHDSVTHIVYSFLAGSVITLVCLIALYIHHVRS